MSIYRCYLLDRSGPILKREDIDCADDEEAIARATEIFPRRDCEVWYGSRRVALLRVDSAD